MTYRASLKVSTGGQYASDLCRFIWFRLDLASVHGKLWFQVEMNVEDYRNMWLEGESLHRVHMLQSHSTKSSNGLFIIFPLLFFDRVDTTAANMKIKTMNYSIKLILTITQFVVVLRGCRMELMVVVYCCIQMDKIIWGVNLTTEALYVWWWQCRFLCGTATCVNCLKCEFEKSHGVYWLLRGILG
jgi:hypothetical protein